MFKAKRRTVVTATALAVVLLGAALAATLLTRGNSTSGETTSDGVVTYDVGHRPLAPDATEKSLTGSTIKLDSYRGKTVVLNFWGSWCPPCQDEASTFAALDAQYSKQGIAFLGDDVQDTPTNALGFTHRYGITYPSFNDPGYLVAQDFTQAGVLVKDPPTTVVIDKTGHVVGTIFGEALYSQVTTLINDAAVS